jgi:hypothetical protein
MESWKIAARKTKPLVVQIREMKAYIYTLAQVKRRGVASYTRRPSCSWEYKLLFSKFLDMVHGTRLDFECEWEVLRQLS